MLRFIQCAVDTSMHMNTDRFVECWLRRTLSPENIVKIIFLGEKDYSSAPLVKGMMRELLSAALHIPVRQRARAVLAYAICVAYSTVTSVLGNALQQCAGTCASYAISSSQNSLIDVILQLSMLLLEDCSYCCQLW